MLVFELVCVAATLACRVAALACMAVARTCMAAGALAWVAAESVASSSYWTPRQHEFPPLLTAAVSPPQTLLLWRDIWDPK